MLAGTRSREPPVGDPGQSPLPDDNSSARSFGALHRDWRLDRSVRVVTDEFEIFELEAVYVFYSRIQFHPRQRPAIAGKLLVRQLKMIVVEMQVAKGFDLICAMRLSM